MAIYTVGVVGAGTMGAGIAQVISYQGIPVVLKEVNEDFLKRGLTTIRKVFEGRVAKGRMTPEELEQRMQLITPTTNDESFKTVDLVIEAVPESMELKKRIFRALDQVCSPGTILATNTSALSISALGAVTERPAQVIGMHFFYPAHVMKLVEVIPGLETTEETVEAVTAFAESLRKIPVKVLECPGFLVNRILMPYLNEAVLCLEEGTCMPDGRAAGVQEIDQAMQALGWPMGPFTLIDALGMDVCAEAGKVLLEGYGKRMRPARLWVRMLQLKRLGRKSGRGFYDYSGVGPTEPGRVDEELQREMDSLREMCSLGGIDPQGHPTGRTASPPATRLPQPSTSPATLRFTPERLMFLLINEAVMALQEGISSASEIDMAVVAGLGYPPSKGGLLHAADQIGIDTLVDTLDRLTQGLGHRFHPAYRLRTMLHAGHLGVKTKRGFFTY
jgi:3-hydroxyacyl-CoA dehydrogenase